MDDTARMRAWVEILFWLRSCFFASRDTARTRAWVEVVSCHGNGHLCSVYRPNGRGLKSLQMRSDLIHYVDIVCIPVIGLSG